MVSGTRKSFLQLSTLLLAAVWAVGVPIFGKKAHTHTHTPNYSNLGRTEMAVNGEEISEGTASEIKAQFRALGLPALTASEVWQPRSAALLRPENQDYDPTKYEE